MHANMLSAAIGFGDAMTMKQAKITNTASPAKNGHFGRFVDEFSDI
jgi:hypothetical protein